MHPNLFKLNDTNNNEDTLFNDGLVSIIGDDLILNFLNDSDSKQNRPQQNTSMYTQYLQEPTMPPYGSYQDPHKISDNYPNIYQRMNMQDQSPWLFPSMNEPNKIQTNVSPNLLNYKMQNREDIDGSSKLKKFKTNSDTGLNVRPASLPKTKPKQNTKNTYINKINKIHHLSMEPDSDDSADSDLQLETKGKSDLKKSITQEAQRKVSFNETVKTVDSYGLEDDEPGLDKFNMKLARNRESARKSRKRKKVYIELLEKKAEELQTELNVTKKQLDQNNNSLDKIAVQNRLMSNLYINKQSLHEKLEKMLTGKADDSEIRILIDSLGLRLGASGTERVAVLKFFFKQILDYMVPVHVRYLLWAAQEGKDMFESNESGLLMAPPQTEISEFYSEIVSQLSLTDAQKKLLNKYRKKFISEKQKMDLLIGNLIQNQKALLKQAKSTQQTIDEFSGVFQPSQFGKLILSLDKDGNKNEFNIWKAWGDLPIESMQTIPTEGRHENDGVTENQRQIIIPELTSLQNINQKSRMNN